jgi:hypothetical protein
MRVSVLSATAAERLVGVEKMFQSWRKGQLTKIGV